MTTEWLNKARTKRMDCPNCGGRSFTWFSDEYYVCQLCEEPDPEFISWYALNWPAAFSKFNDRTIARGGE